MTSTIYLDTASKVARAALTGTALPAVSAKLLSHLKLVIKCFDGADIITVDADTMTCVIKPKNAPAGAPALIDTSAVFTGSGETAQYVFEWASADSVALRAHLDAAADPTQPQELRCEIECEIDGNPERVAFPIYFETSYTRPEDPAPEANADSSWEWLKTRVQAGDNLTRTLNETTKVMILSVPDFADGREIELQAGVTHIQWRYVGDESWTNLVALSAITGPAGADGADSTVPGPQGEDGSEIELQAGVTHLQWRYVGAMSWTDLIALSAITGPAGADGADAYPVASQAEAEAGTANDKSMTPERTAQAIAALAGGNLRQVVMQSITTPVTGNQASGWVSIMSASITTTQADSRVICLVFGTWGGASNSASSLGFRVMRAGAAISQGDAAGSRTRVGAGGIVGLIGSASGTRYAGGPFSMIEMDAPGSLASHTYTLEANGQNISSSTFTWAVGSLGYDVDVAGSLRAPTKIMLIEVAP